MSRTSAEKAKQVAEALDTLVDAGVDVELLIDAVQKIQNVSDANTFAILDRWLREQL